MCEVVNKSEKHEIQQKECASGNYQKLHTAVLHGRKNTLKALISLWNKTLIIVLVYRM